MSQRLKDNITSAYFEAANQLASKKARRKIIAYVESYDDILFWRTVLSKFENSERYFEVMLPSHETLQRGKKSVLMNFLGDHVGKDLIACVDADYDYLMQGASPTSERVINSPYVFHTYVYAIENFQCYAESLHNVCVMVTLNDHSIFDFESFLHEYSEICYPLFVWNIWAYRTNNYSRFSLTDFAKIIDTGRFSIHRPEESLEHLRNKVKHAIKSLHRIFPDTGDSLERVSDDIQQLGVRPDETYLYIQGHHIFDTVVAPMVGKVCDQLRMERENEIYRTSVHRTQLHNELSCYENSLQDVRQMLKKNTGYALMPQFLKIQKNVEAYLQQ